MRFAQIFLASLVAAAGVANAAAEVAVDDLVAPTAMNSCAAPLRQRAEKRVRVGHFDRAVLNGMTVAAEHADGASHHVRLPLFDDAVYEFNVEHRQRSAPGRSVVVGKIANGESGRALMNSAIISTVGSATAASVIAPDGRIFQITQIGAEACRIAELDRDHLGDCGDLPAQIPFRPLSFLPHPEVVAGNLPPTAPALPLTVPPPAGADVATGPTIDVMMVYTAAARAGAGGTEAMQALCQLAVAQANQAFANSNVNAQVRLVHTEEIAYQESGSAPTDLARLQNPTDGFLDQVQGLRDQYQADVVHLVVETMTSYSGLAYFGVSKLGIFPEYAYGVDKREFLAPFTFAHELAHNFGLDHDRENATKTSDGSMNAAFSYGFGNRFTSPDDNVQYRTIMAYAPGTQVLYYSNPNLSYLDASLGVAKDAAGASDDARALTNAAAIVADFRGAGQSSSSPHILVADNKGKPQNSISFDSPGVGSQSAPAYFYLFNSGGQTLQISNLKEGGANPSDFPLILQDNSVNIQTGNHFSIGAGKYFYIAVYFKPGAAGERSASITFSTNDPTPGRSTVEFKVVGSVRPRLANISTRLPVGTGDGVLIGGFIVQGTANKKVLLRATGPSLAANGVAGALSDPAIELYSGSTLIASNDDWGSGTDRQAIMDTGLAPTSDLESGLIATLAPGAYTAIVRGAAGQTGTALVEAFDLDPDTTSRLGNISTRGRVGTDNDVMIGGVVVTGKNPQKVLVRGLGPSLAAQGVGDALANPTLEIYNGQTLVAQNDDWQTGGQGPDIQATGLAPASDQEAAIITTLAPGSYTAILRGAGGGTGTALIEVYTLP